MGARGSLVRIGRLLSKIFTVAVMLAALGSGVVAYYGIDDGRPSVCFGDVVSDGREGAIGSWSACTG